jgi:hypothetical protein
MNTADMFEKNVNFIKIEAALVLLVQWGSGQILEVGNFSHLVSSTENSLLLG